MSGWTDAETREAVARWRSGESARVIAEAMGRTRNAIIGRLARVGEVGSSRTLTLGKPVGRPSASTYIEIGAGDCFGATGSAHRASDAGGAVSSPASHVHGGPAGKAMPIAAESEGSPIALPARLAGRVSRSPVGEAVLNLGHGECKWPIGDPKGGGRFGFCCARALPGKPYCEEHTTKARGDLRAVQPAPLRMSLDSAVVLA